MSNIIGAWSGGYWDQPGPGELLEVGFAGNSHIAPEKLGQYLLYRVAEVSNERGYSHFIMYENLSAAIGDVRIQERKIRSAFGKPHSSVFVLFENTAGQGVISVASVFEQLGPIVNPEKRDDE